MNEHINKIYQGDCMELLALLPSESVDLVVTSPPYNLQNTTGAKGNKGGLTKGSPSSDHFNGDWYDSYNDNMPHDEYVKWQRSIIAKCLRVLKPTGALFYNHKERVQGGLLQHRHDILAGFPLRQRIIWDRGGGLNFNKTYFLPTHEDIYLIAKPDFDLTREAIKLGTVWRIAPETKNEHPAPFPLAIPMRCIQSAKHNDLILDPFAGSGTTLKAAQILGKKWIGSELSPIYVAMAQKKLNESFTRMLI